jgi:hypothetical protein
MARNEVTRRRSRTRTLTLDACFPRRRNRDHGSAFVYVVFVNKWPASPAYRLDSLFVSSELAEQRARTMYLADGETATVHARELAVAVHEDFGYADTLRSTNVFT